MMGLSFSHHTTDLKPTDERGMKMDHDTANKGRLEAYARLLADKLNAFPLVASVTRSESARLSLWVLPSKPCLELSRVKHDGAQVYVAFSRTPTGDQPLVIEVRSDTDRGCRLVTITVRGTLGADLGAVADNLAGGAVRMTDAMIMASQQRQADAA